MKKKLMIIGMIVLLILANSITIYAATESTVVLQADKTEVKAGETFTVTVKVESPDGINGIDTTYSYDTEKLELQTASVSDSNFTDLSGGVQGTITLMGLATTVTDTNIYTLTFKVKEGITAGSTAKVSLGETYLSTFAQTDSDYTIPAQDITITVAAATSGEGEGDGDEDCSHSTYETKYNNTQHWEQCSECSEIKAGSTATHTYGTYTDNNDGTHSSTCTVCGYKRTEAHSYVNGKCDDCGAVKTETEDECEHTYGSYTDNKNGTHTAKCSKCGEELTESHSTDKACEKCGYTPTGSNGASNNNGSSNNGSSNNNSSSDTAKDNYPKAGSSTLLVVGLLTIIIVAIVIYRKNQKYQDIK